ncbi:MAG TPA: type IV secretion system protein TraC [Burkholderiaceae bacterium]|nr:type IV secretion system protein TraC [Burkholderiaceae bacterium]
MNAVLEWFNEKLAGKKSPSRPVKAHELAIPVDLDPDARMGRWLPYDSFRSDLDIFTNLDSIGFCLEFIPQSGADASMQQTLHSIYQRLPPGCCIQTTEFASPNLRDLLAEYANLRMLDPDAREQAIRWGRPARNSNVHRMMARGTYEFFNKYAATPLLHQQAPIFRNFRGVLSCTLPGSVDDMTRVEELIAIRDAIATTLRSAMLPNFVWNASHLINWVADLTNPERLFGRTQPLSYDDGREIRYQCVSLSTRSDSKDPTRLRFTNVLDPREEIHTQTFAIRRFPERFGLWQMGALIGDPLSQTLHYPVPFVITMGVYVPDTQKAKGQLLGESIKGEQDAKSEVAKYTPSLAEKKKDQDLARQALDRGERIVELYHKVTVFARPQDLERAGASAIDIWNARGFELELETNIQRQSFIASLPMTLGPSLYKDLTSFKRFSRKSSGNAVNLSPFIGEWRGTRTPLILMAGRRHGMLKLDFYDNEIGNKNFCMAGTSGAGKSQTLNLIAEAYASTGSKVWIVEPGNSFMRLCQICNGQMIHFGTHGKRPRINPFSWVRDIKEDMQMLLPMASKMASPKSDLLDVQYKALGAMIMQLYNEYGADMTITAVRDRFKAQVMNSEIEDQAGAAKEDQRFLDLATLLSDFSKGGTYEDFFDGPADVDFEKDLIYIETEGLQSDESLRVVVQMVMIYRITQDMFRTDISRKKLLLLDEARKMLGGFTQTDTAMLQMVTDLYLRARKRNGAVGAATQSMGHFLETKASRSIFDSSDFKIWLYHEADSIEYLSNMKELDIDEPMKHALKAMSNDNPYFKDCYIRSPLGSGSARIFMDPFRRLMFSNRAEDNIPLDQRVARGMSWGQAVEDLMRERQMR